MGVDGDGWGWIGSGWEWMGMDGERCNGTIAVREGRVTLDRHWPPLPSWDSGCKVLSCLLLSFSGCIVFIVLYCIYVILYVSCYIVCIVLYCIYHAILYLSKYYNTIYCLVLCCMYYVCMDPPARSARSAKSSHVDGHWLLIIHLSG